MTQHDSEPLLKAAWVGSSAGALDLGLAASNLMSTMPSEQLLGTSAGSALALGYVVAGGAALYTDVVGYDG
ncbi:hypothetical protein PN419_13700 [Halorubrum ezzemoulense]|uniref:hypothetical protein n=1 Tax=Halorubrum ezzemoulense TaxID=337243 RepID=UPI0023314B5B|nr:hypothetical protein [Halorubrum ezzemoulense]MDB9250039.1 hypothetical protein [Halorubrum ezzemoulense]MDB9260064.1 hypothetical protein [Halorubrum ezzemoulense]MDB9264407.1 hypothetical protein [Halorubrum ezzemoulense]MDB9267084.1 hypothetical protein [Halorubrum ezzemoulense]MDB9270425.1 hypothetical protein [Halorubrum ezzemoulense]